MRETGIGRKMCDVCGQTFANNYGLRMHFEIKHLRIKRYQCQKCCKRFWYSSSKIKHEKYSFCGKRNSEKQRMKSAEVDEIWVNSNTESSEIEIIICCDVCDEQFLNQNELVAHFCAKHKAVLVFT